MNTPAKAKLPVLKTIFRVLTFQATKEELLSVDRRHLIVGLVFALISGMARTWDNPTVSPLQHTGIGSFAYVFVFSFFIWLIVKPLRPSNWSLKSVTTYIAMVAPIGIVYGFPIEMMVDMETAQAFNMGLLTIVATWRLFLLVRYLYVVGELKAFTTAIATLLPMSLLIVALAVLRIDKMAMYTMGGFHGTPSSEDAVNQVLFTVTICAICTFVPVALIYLGAIVYRWRQATKLARTAGSVKATAQLPS